MQTAFSLHDHNSTSPPPSSSQSQSSRRTTRSASRAKSNSTLAEPIMNGVAANGNGKAKPAKRRTRSSANASVDLDADNEAEEVLVSPAVLRQMEQQNGPSATTRSRHKKSKSKSKAHQDLAVDTHAANIRIANGNGVAGKVKARVIDWEIPRKAFHSSIGFLTLGLYMTQGSAEPVVKTLLPALVIIVPADFLRLKWPGPGSAFARLYEKLLGFLMRESEKNHSNGVIWYIIGVSFALYFYPLDIAVVSILILSWADTAASTIGRLWGASTPPLPPQTPILRLPLAPRKSTAGFIAAAVTGTLITVGFYKYLGPMRPHDLTWTFENGVSSLKPAPNVISETLAKWGWEGLNTGGWAGLGLIGVVAGLVAGVAEALDLGGLDDNLTLPIISGGCIWGFFKFLSIFSS